MGRFEKSNALDGFGIWIGKSFESKCNDVQGNKKEIYDNITIGNKACTFRRVLAISG